MKSPACAAEASARRPAPGAAYFDPSTPPRTVAVLADVYRLADGTFKLVTRKPRLEVEEISTARAAELLGLGITAMKALRDSALGQKYLRWRFTTESKKILRWELPSVLAFREATKEIGK